MQLKRRRAARIGAALGALTANLLAVTTAHAQAEQTGSGYGPSPDAASSSLDAGSDIGSGVTRVDSAVLLYQEAGSRVKAVEPVVSVALNASDGETLSLRYTADTLTGATPNGATPWIQPQTFTTPARAPSTTTTVTGASGGAQLVTIPGSGTVVRQYTGAANQLPLDPGFRDQRNALDIGYATPWGPTARWSIGGGYSKERDFTSYSVNTGLSHDFNDHNTRLSAAVNFEFDNSSPLFGVPTAFTAMNGDRKGGAKSRMEEDFVVGVTQAMTRFWVMQLNYSYGALSGYQTDPYRILSVIDPSSGAPVQYLYESRPNQRTRQSVYLANKLALGPTFADVSARLYHDDWGISSSTVEASDRIPLFSNFYVEPGARYYHQSKADFFDNYLLSGAPLPHYASSDNRLDAFSATTTSLQLGYEFAGRSSELYLRYQDYRQTGPSHPAGAIGVLANQHLFGGADATSVVVGLSLAIY